MPSPQWPGRPRQREDAGGMAPQSDGRRRAQTPSQGWLSLLPPEVRVRTEGRAVEGLDGARRVERGERNPTASKIIAIAIALDCSVAQLFRGLNPTDLRRDG